MKRIGRSFAGVTKNGHVAWGKGMSPFQVDAWLLSGPWFWVRWRVASVRWEDEIDVRSVVRDVSLLARIRRCHV